MILSVERLVSSCGGLSVVIGHQCHNDKSSAKMLLCAVFTRDTVSRFQIDLGSVVAIHPPWLVCVSFLQLAVVSSNGCYR